jgi:hypothetical protein
MVDVSIFCIIDASILNWHIPAAKCYHCCSHANNSAKKTTIYIYFPKTFEHELAEKGISRRSVAANDD